MMNNKESIIAAINAALLLTVDPELIMFDDEADIFFPSKLEFQCNKPLLKLVQNLYPSKNSVRIEAF